MTIPGSNFVHRLQAELQRRTPATLSDGEAQRAAVAVIVTAEADPALLFVKRRERAGDPWSGHVAFPGGFAAPSDPSPEATAARETLEETGLVLEAGSLGRLSDVYPRTVHLPRVIVTPVVFLARDRSPVAASPEVERALWLPVAELRDPANRGTLSLDRPDGNRTFPTINVGGLAIWGLTERILSELLTYV